MSLVDALLAAALASAGATPGAAHALSTLTSGFGRAPQAPVGQISKPRKPKKGRTIVPSPLRPHVLSSDRLEMWSTPHTSTYNDNLHSNLSSDAVSTLLHILLASLDIATRRNYGSGLLRFTYFCDEQHTPEASRMPASETLLSAFCASWARKVAATTVSTWLAGLHFWHKFHGALARRRDLECSYQRCCQNGPKFLQAPSAPPSHHPAHAHPL
jgi:hypothetical protein